MKRKKFFRGVFLVLGCCVPLLFVAGCGLTDTIKCTWCGDSKNRVLCYSSGTTSAGTEYKSCVGPSGCLGLGCNTRCIPVECLYIEKTKDKEKFTGTVCYYNSFGCIDSENAKSHGEFDRNTTCLGLNCVGEHYVEDITDEKTEAYTQDNCLGASCGSKEYVKSEDLSKALPRQFPNGCWSCSEPVSTMSQPKK